MYCGIKSCVTSDEVIIIWTLFKLLYSTEQAKRPSLLYFSTIRRNGFLTHHKHSCDHRLTCVILCAVMKPDEWSPACRQPAVVLKMQATASGHGIRNRLRTVALSGLPTVYTPFSTLQLDPKEQYLPLYIRTKPGKNNCTKTRFERKQILVSRRSDISHTHTWKKQESAGNFDIHCLLFSNTTNVWNMKPATFGNSFNLNGKYIAGTMRSPLLMANWYSIDSTRAYILCRAVRDVTRRLCQPHIPRSEKNGTLSMVVKYCGKPLSQWAQHFRSP